MSNQLAISTKKASNYSSDDEDEPNYALGLGSSGCYVPAAPRERPSNSLPGTVSRPLTNGSTLPRASYASWALQMDKNRSDGNTFAQQDHVQTLAFHQRENADQQKDSRDFRQGRNDLVSMAPMEHPNLTGPNLSISDGAGAIDSLPLVECEPGLAGLRRRQSVEEEEVLNCVRVGQFAHDRPEEVRTGHTGRSKLALRRTGRSRRFSFWPPELGRPGDQQAARGRIRESEKRGRMEQNRQDPLHDAVSTPTTENDSEDDCDSRPELD